MNEYERFNSEINSGNYLGTYGGAYSLYRCLAEIRKNKDILKYNRLKETEYLNENLLEHLNNPLTRKKWNDISSINPLGLTSQIPTIACTTATLNIPELKDKLFNDGVIVDSDGGINVTKIAVQYTWNINKLSKNLEFSQNFSSLFKYVFTNRGISCFSILFKILSKFRLSFTIISPLVGFNKPFKISTKVVFPDPEAPIIPIASPALMVIEISSIA